MAIDETKLNEFMNNFVRDMGAVAHAATVSSRLGETACTIDVDQEVVEERRIAAAGRPVVVAPKPCSTVEEWLERCGLEARNA